MGTSTCAIFSCAILLVPFYRAPNELDGRIISDEALFCTIKGPLGKTQLYENIQIRRSLFYTKRYPVVPLDKHLCTCGPSVLKSATTNHIMERQY